MGKSLIISIVVLVVLVLVLLALVCDAQSRPDSGNNNSTVVTRSRSNQRGGLRGRGANPTSGRRRPGGRRTGTRFNRNQHPSCEEIYLPMCKGLVPYTHTKLPNRFNHTTQQEVYRVIEHLWAHMDHSCSKNTRLMVCSLYLPKCHGRGTGLEPCRRTCMAARRLCKKPLKEMLRIEWGQTFNCRRLVNRRCLRPIREETCQYEHPTCVENRVMPICTNITFTHGTMPNMFQQCSMQEINTEVQHYDALLATRCHDHLNFLLCGVFSPYCIRAERPFGFPCRELCEEIRAACEPHYRRLYNNLTWPNKLQCHRYPSTEMSSFQCVMPNEGALVK